MIQETSDGVEDVCGNENVYISFKVKTSCIPLQDNIKKLILLQN